MRAVILAAGEGRRLSHLSQGPKALLPLLGIPLIGRAVLSLKNAGVEEIIVVVGYQGQRIREALSHDPTVKFIDNPQWHKGNGTSLLSAKDLLGKDERFLAVMADHIFDPAILKGLMEKAQEEADLLLTDSRLDEVSDLLETATKVYIDDEGHISEIGGEIKIFNGVDCGILLLTPEIFLALEEAQSEGGYNLSDGLRLLARRGRLMSFPMNSYWQDVDTPADLRRAEAKLLRSLPTQREGIISQYLNRPLSLLITRALARLPIGPNLVSLLSLLIALASASLFSLKVGLPAGALAQLSSIIDGVDGELARLKFLSSPYGALLDALMDRYGDALIILGMAYYAYSQSPGLLVLFASLLALAGAPMSMLIKEKFENSFARPYPAHFDSLTRYLLAGRDGRLFVIMVGGITGQVFAALLFIAITCHIQAIYRLVALHRLAMRG